MQTRALETLVRIHEVQSFSRAADLQNMTLSALSMQMKSLETELNAEIFDRTFRPPKLTPLGQEVAQKAKKVLDQLNELTALCGADKELSGRFRLGVISSVAIRMIPSFVHEFALKAPLAKFDVVTGLSEDLMEQVRLGQLDGAVVTRVSGAQTDLQFETVRREEMSYAAPMSHKDKDLGALASALPFIQFNPLTGIGKLIADRLRSLEAPPKRTIVLDNLEASMEFVKQGLGYTLLPKPDILRWADRNVHIVTDLPFSMFRELAFVSRKDSLSRRWNAEILNGFNAVEASAMSPKTTPAIRSLE